MRIRTIKPEFWLHEGLAKCSEFARLLAIALLNWADDEGYFMANPILIRGQVFPFDDDSTKVRRSLDELSSVGWIRLGIDDQGRSVGIVINFEKHQRVDRAKPSAIKGNISFDDHSTINRRSIDDQSTEEGKGMEGKGIPPNPQGGMWDEKIEMIDKEKPSGPHESNALPSPTDPSPLPAIDTHENNSKPSTGHPDAKSSNTIPNGWKNMTAIQKKQTRVKNNTPEMLAIGGLMGRRDGNLWSVAEALALEAVSPQPEEIAEMSRYYLADIDRDKDYRRRDLITLLNNWNGELDRARIFKSN